MASESPREDPAAQNARAAKAPAPEATARAAQAGQPAEEPEVSAETDTLESSGSGPAPGLLARLNPFRYFRRASLEGYINEGKDLLENGSLAQATVAFNKALELAPDNVPALRGLGKVYFKKGGRSNLETALQHYQTAIRNDPWEHDLYAISAKIYDALGKRKEATLERKKFVIVRALEADEKNPIANNNMGILFLQQGRMDEALEYFNRAVQVDRHYDVAHRNLAAAYFQLAKKATSDEEKADCNAKAREAIQNALAIAQSVPSLMAHARIQMMDGTLEEALSTLQKVDEMDPANAEVHLMLRMVYEGLGRFEEAKSAQESYLAFKRQAAPAPAEPEE